MAATLLRGAPQLADFEPEAIVDPAISALRGRVSVAASPDFDSRYPAHFGARVTVTLDDGTTLSQTVADAWGDSENPTSPADIVAKYDNLAAAAGLTATTAAQLREAILALPGTPDLEQFQSALAALP